MNYVAEIWIVCVQKTQLLGKIVIGIFSKYLWNNSGNIHNGNSFATDAYMG